MRWLGATSLWSLLTEYAVTALTFKEQIAGTVGIEILVQWGTRRGDLILRGGDRHHEFSGSTKDEQLLGDQVKLDEQRFEPEVAPE